MDFNHWQFNPFGNCKNRSLHLLTLLYFLIDKLHPTRWIWWRIKYDKMMRYDEGYTGWAECPTGWGFRPTQVCEYLNREFSDRLVGRDGPISWPPQSEDITPLDISMRLCQSQSLPDTFNKPIGAEGSYHSSACDNQPGHATAHLARTWIPVKVLHATNSAHVVVT